MRGLRIRPTYANVVATLALFIALGGTAIATHPGGQNTISTADIIDAQVKAADIDTDAVKTGELANAEVKVADIGPAAVAADELAANSVGAAKIADGQVNVAEIATGAVRTAEIQNGQVQAEDLAPGVAPGASGARAWGQVLADGFLFRSKNVTSVTHPQAGVYCIDPGPGIDTETAVMVVGADTQSNDTDVNLNDVSQVEWHSGAGICPGGTMEVQTFLGDGVPGQLGGTDSGGFNLIVDDEGFAFVIP
jgi:hypothetical protein